MTHMGDKLPVVDLGERFINVAPRYSLESGAKCAGTLRKTVGQLSSFAQIHN